MAKRKGNPKMKKAAQVCKGKKAKAYRSCMKHELKK